MIIKEINKGINITSHKLIKNEKIKHSINIAKKSLYEN